METICKSCHKKFHTKISILKKGKGKFCSRACYGNWLKTAKIKRFDIAEWVIQHRDEWREKHLKAVKGCIPWNKGKKIWVGEKRKNLKLPPTGSGEKHPNWKGGKWFWARRVTLKRDNYTCQICKLREPKIMEVAHKNREGNYVNYSESVNRMYLVHNPDDLITLCPNCHAKYDKGLINL